MLEPHWGTIFHFVDPTHFPFKSILVFACLLFCKTNIIFLASKLTIFMGRVLSCTLFYFFNSFLKPLSKYLVGIKVSKVDCNPAFNVSEETIVSSNFWCYPWQTQVCESWALCCTLSQTFVFCPKIYFYKLTLNF